MLASELIGKEVLRTKETIRGDFSFTTNPILILKVTDSHIYYEYLDKMWENRTFVLNYTWMDDNWTEYKPVRKHIRIDM